MCHQIQSLLMLTWKKLLMRGKRTKKLNSVSLVILEQLAKDWNAPIYVFFGPVPLIEYVSQQHSHLFQCAMKTCVNRSQGVWQFLDKKDAGSMSNMRKHAKKCWRADVVMVADKVKTADDVWEVTVEGVLNAQSITTAFGRTGKGKITYTTLITNIRKQRLDECFGLSSQIDDWAASIGWKLSTGYLRACVLSVSSTIEGFKAWWKQEDPDITYLHLEPSLVMSDKSLWKHANELWQYYG